MFGQVSILAHYICTVSSRTFPHLQRTNCSSNIYHFCLSNPQFPLFKIQPCLSISTCSTISTDASPATISSDASPVASMNIMNGDPLLQEWWHLSQAAWAKAATRPPVVGRHVCSSPRQGSGKNIELKLGNFPMWKLLPSGNLLHSYGKSPFLMGKSTISMVIFNSKLLNYQRVYLRQSMSVKSALHDPPQSAVTLLLSQVTSLPHVSVAAYDADMQSQNIKTQRVYNICIHM